MTGKEAEDFIYHSYLKAEKFWNYEDKDEKKRHPEFTKEILEKRKTTPCVLVTGSKGKGSAAAMTAAILETGNLKTGNPEGISDTAGRSGSRIGLMTSPHLTSFCERFRINGHMMTEQELIRYISQVKPEFEILEAQLKEDECISPMGIQAAVGLDFFREMGTDFNVLECGKGVKTDDVNNIPHEYAVINRVFLEHTRELGNTLTEIAENKAAIITKDVKCAYTAMQSPEVLEILQKKADQENVRLKQYGKDFFAEKIRYSLDGMRFDLTIKDESGLWKRFKDCAVPLLGEYQAENCALAAACCMDVMAEQEMEWNTEKIKERLKRLQWPGRMEVFSKPGEQFILLDACINRASCGALKETLTKLGICDIILVAGIPDDKDYAGVVQEMKALSDCIILTAASNPHYRFTGEQEKNLKQMGIRCETISDAGNAIEQAKSYGKPVVILGTTALVAEIKKIPKYKKQEA